MREFLNRALLFAAIQCGILAALFGLYRVDENAYAASFIDKHDRLEQAPGPRLLLAGGSNVGFSTDSALLEARLGLHPVDLSIQHALGLTFMLGELRQGMREGDVVALSPEYGQYISRTEEPLSLLGVLEQDRRARGAIDLDWRLFKAFGDKSHLWLRGVLRSVVQRALGRPGRATPPYSRDSFNRYGDVTAHWTMPRVGFEVNAQSEQGADREALVELNEFFAECRARGVRVFIFHPAVPRRKFDAMRLEELAAVIDRELQIPQLNRISEMTYPDELFFDTVYHLTRPGVTQRTELLAERLARALSLPR